MIIVRAVAAHKSFATTLKYQTLVVLGTYINDITFTYFYKIVFVCDSVHICKRYA